jgi:ssDNA-binding Zn-finger/Zn-ribbon topoisomerase 1
LNICPNCGDTLSVKDTAWYGRILGCPNYPSCRHLVKIDDIKDGAFMRIYVRGSN